MQPAQRRLSVPLALILTAAAALGQNHQFESEPLRAWHYYLSGTMTAFAVGNIDADPDLEVITAHQNPFPASTWISVLDPLPGGGGTATQISGLAGTPAVATPIDFELLDLDNDGDLDLLMAASDTANQVKTTIRFFQNDGTGTLTDVTSISFPGLAGVTYDADDFDGDGDIDVVLSTRTSAGVTSALSLYEQVGAFQFALRATALPATLAANPEFADVDCDGDKDIAATSDTGELLCFTNDNGTFTGAVIDTGSFVYVIGDDLDGDGDDDLLAQRDDASVDVLLASAGTFTSSNVLTKHSYPYKRPRFADLDGDNDLDATMFTDGQLIVLRNDGLANFSDEPIAHSSFAEPVDIDEDGILDLLLLVSGGITPAYSRPTGFAFDPAMLRPTNPKLQGAHFADIADFDNDSDGDLLYDAANSMYVIQNLSCGEWQRHIIRTQVTNPVPRATDIDGDGDDDIVMTSSNVGGAVGLQVLRNDGDFAFTPLPTQPLASGYFTAEGDFDGDGRTDLLFTDNNSLQLFNGTIDCVFGPSTTIYSSPADYSETAVVDFDGDQDLDILLPSSLSYVMLLTNDGSGNFSLTDLSIVQLPYFQMTLVDIDNDGDMDIYSSDYGEGQLLRNDNGTFTPGQVLDGSSNTLQHPIFADWDGDGDMDMMHDFGNSEDLWLQDETGTFTNQSHVRFGPGGAGTATAADLDGDGDIDPIPVFGFSTFAWTNHQRSARSLQVPTIGGEMRVQFSHEPGYATDPGICIPILSLARRSTPLAVPGFEGLLQIDLLQSALLPYLVLAVPYYTQVSTFAIPPQAELLGIELYAQGLMLTDVAAWTPAVHERVF